MDKQISKIQFRQDTLENWNAVNPILAEGEPGFLLPNAQYIYGALKIGDGVKHWNELEYQTTAGECLQDIQQADGKLYGRQWNPAAQTAHWQEIALPKEKGKDFIDLMQSPYNQEVDMGYSFVKEDGNLVPVFAIKKKFLVTQGAGVLDTESIEINGKVSNILQIGGTIRTDDKHYYSLPCSSGQYSLNVSIDEENERRVIEIQSYSINSRAKAPIDIFIIYTKEM